MRKVPILIVLLFPLFTNAQTLEESASNAFLITRMAEKFHYDPKPIDQQFSEIVFNSLLHQLDSRKMFFLQSDIKQLQQFKSTLASEVLNRKTDFLKQLASRYEQRLRQADSLMTLIAKQPVNLYADEKYSLKEDTNYVENLSALKAKLNKIMKQQVLFGILENEEIQGMPESERKKLIDSMEPILRKKAQSRFSRSLQFMSMNKNGIAQAVGNAYCKSIASFYDPHTNFFPLNEKQSFDTELGDKVRGFGLLLEEDEEGQVSIDNLLAGSAAFKSGQLNKGDKIVSIQWDNKEPIDVADADVQQVSAILQNADTDKILIKIKKEDGSFRQVTLWKETMEDDTEEDKVKGFLLKGKRTVGYISLPVFYDDWENEDNNIEGCANDVAREILKLKRENIEGLILDLRYNGGGSLKEAIELAGIFIDVGPVAQLKPRDAKIVSLRDVKRGTIYDGPLMLLVNGYSASASELVAATLQDYNRALIVGTPTFGKATGQTVLPLDTTITMDGNMHNKAAASYVKMTVFQLFRVNGQTAQSEGVIPDIILPDITLSAKNRESRLPNVIAPTVIDPSKYFKPSAPLPLQQIKTGAESELRGDAFFKEINVLVEYYRSKEKPEDLSLNITDHFKKQVNDDVLSNHKPVFTIEDHGYSKNRLATNERMNEMNEALKEHLNGDPYLDMAYRIMLKMFK